MCRQLAWSECCNLSGLLFEAIPNDYVLPLLGLTVEAHHLLVQQVPLLLHGRVAPCNRPPYKPHHLKTHLNRTPQTTFLPSLPASTKSHHYHVALSDHLFPQILTTTKLNQSSMVRWYLRMPWPLMPNTRDVNPPYTCPLETLSHRLENLAQVHLVV
jgi:hypothetical protein